MIQGSIRDYSFMLPRLKKELEETKAELASEIQLWNELKEINQALQSRRQDLAKMVESGMGQESNKTKQAIRERRAHVQDLTRELTMFLKKHYPPIQPDVSMIRSKGICPHSKVIKNNCSSSLSPRL